MSEINFLYWNAGNHNISSYIADACIENDINVLILSEHKNVDVSYLLRKLKNSNMIYEVERVDKDSRIMLLHNTKKQINIINESPYYSVFNIKDGEEKYLLFTVHLPSRYSQERIDLNMYASQVLREFEQFEEIRGTEKSIVVGDFNMNPFDDGMVSALSFNAVMCPKIAERKSRKVLHEERKFYYNPMWNLMGNSSNLCKGTFYYSSETKSYYWYTYDQVILRPDLIDKFDMNELKIIDIVNNRKLTTEKAIPDKKRISDHLPIKFKMEVSLND